LVIAGIKKSLSDLGLEYLDLYLIHWPMAYVEERELFPKDTDGKFIYSDVDYLETWKVMEECVRLGLTKSIGVSNFNSQQIDRILAHCTIKPANLQVHKLVELN
jgi:diketogulonate reductase-like aldo/keto reductase